MDNTDLLQAITTRPIVCDGAMGTQLIALGIQSSDSSMVWNVERPNDVRSIHEAYRRAGCELITTNSFGGSSLALQRHGHAARARELNQAAARVAREAAGAECWVLGDVGPCGDFLEPLGDTTPDELRESFRVQIEALITGGADAILIETMSDPAEAVVGIEAAREVSTTIPVIVTYAFQKGASGQLNTMMGTTVVEAVDRATAAGAQIVGANCGSSLDFADYLELARQLVAAASIPVILQPNAGAPRVENGTTVYDASPEKMATVARQLLDAGVRVIGGCCGTTPQHLAAVAAAVRNK